MTKKYTNAVNVATVKYANQGMGYAPFVPEIFLSYSTVHSFPHGHAPPVVFNH